MHYESRVGHLGGNLSCLEMMLHLYTQTLGRDDHFVLSKGHAAGALYICLWMMDRLSDEELCLFHKDGTRLCGHPAAGGIDEVLFATGSLGHGLSLACGLSLAKQLKREPGRVFCLMSDGEWNEGSCWEALIFAAHRRLENLVILTDLNGLQGFGTTKEVADLGSLTDRLQSFGVEAIEIDGHDFESIRHALELDVVGPLAIVARTRKGRGISFMENRMEWHYLPMNEMQYNQAVQEINDECAMLFASHS
jgi:transketolase